jgi:hypothetical protein
MSVRLSIELDDEIAAGLDKLIDDMSVVLPRELVAAAVLREWLIAAGYLPNDAGIEEDTPTQGEGNSDKKGSAEAEPLDLRRRASKLDGDRSKPASSQTVSQAFCS